MRTDVGTGEYLDRMAMFHARCRVVQAGMTVGERVTIQKISFMGFVVDGEPFRRWFDMEKLRHIHFKSLNIDAGFYIPEGYETKIEVSVENCETSRKGPMFIRPLALVSAGLKIVDIKERQKVGERMALTGNGFYTDEVKQEFATVLAKGVTMPKEMGRKDGFDDLMCIFDEGALVD